MHPQSTERMRFRLLGPDDAQLMSDLNHAPGVMKYLNHEPPSFEYVLSDEIPKRLTISRKYPGYGLWFAHLGESDPCIGWFALTPNTQIPGEAEIGYRLFPEYWSRGYATEGARVLLRYAFEELRVQRCVATTMAVNLGSRKVMERIGLKHVRTFHEEFEHPLPGTEYGEVEYALSRKEWLLCRS